MIFQGNNCNANNGYVQGFSLRFLGIENRCISDGFSSSAEQVSSAALVKEDGSILSATKSLCELLDCSDPVSLLSENLYSFVHRKSRGFLASSIARSAHAYGFLGPVEMKMRKVSDSSVSVWARFSRIPIGEKSAIYISFQEIPNLSKSLKSGFDYAWKTQDIPCNSFVDGLVMALGVRDSETLQHSKNVIDLTVRLGKALGVSSWDMFHMRRGALLHDVGKLAIPDRVLKKEGPLSDAEWIIMKQHPVIAKEMLSPYESLKPSVDIPYSHHERWDGSGYPDGLAGKSIPFPARIFAVVDVYDALSSDRCYRDAWDPDDAKDYVKEQSGILFDPDIVTAFLKIDLSRSL